MKVSELRLGNYLIVPGIDRIVQVRLVCLSHFSCVDKDGIVLGESVRINYQPIPLTEELLLKFGFKKYVSDDIDIDIDFQISFHKKSSEGLIVQLFMDSNGVIFFNHSGISLYSIHHLQNLYFALTGEELVVKE